MNRLLLVFAFVLTLTFWAFSTPTYAGVMMGMCYSDEDCTRPTDYLCAYSQGECVEEDDDYYFGSYCDYDDAVLVCKREFDSRGDCISSGLDYKCGDLTGKDRAACNKKVQAFCDCAVELGCTDKPNGPPVDEEPL